MKTNQFLQKIIQNTFFALLLLLMVSCTEGEIKITHQNLVIEIDENLKTKINSNFENAKKISDEFTCSEILIGKNRKYKKFKKSSYKISEGKDSIGEFESHIVIGILVNDGYKLEKKIEIKIYKNINDLAVYNVSYTNVGDKIIQPKKWISNYSKIETDSQDSVVWSFQGESTSARADWILPVKKGFNQQNFMGMNNSDYGGGIPITDIWRRDVGMAKGHLEMVPKQVSLPVSRKLYSDETESWIEYEYPYTFDLTKGESLETFETFVMVHQGDCYKPLQQFSKLMQLKGIEFVESEEAAFEPIWCAWGYERNFNLDEIIGTLPKVKELGFKWAVLDDGFQQAEGDWDVNRNKFPNGDADMINFVNKIHSYGLKAKLWWAPLAADPGSKLLEENPEMMLYTEDWAPQFITWWDSYYLAPTYEKTIQHTKDVVHLFLEKWGFDGLKMDGQHMNAVPPDHNGDHNIDYPEQAVEQLPQFYKMVYETARSIKPNAVIENCPCGTCMSFYNMPYINQSVSSDPLNSWQIRLKGKVYKAIIPNIAYYGDHVELSDGAEDFASSFGVGAVLGTKFTWPKDNPSQSQSYLLTPEKEVKWKKWIGLYNEKMLSKEDYLGNLYDIGFDIPETHVIEKADTMYYAFYNKDWKGNIELRGLENDKNYIAFDYINEKEIARFAGDNPNIKAEFTDYLLIAVYSDE